MATRHIMRIELSAAAKKKFSSVGDQYGMTQLSVTSSVVDWYSKQTGAIQAEIVRNADGKADKTLLPRILKTMAGIK